MSQPEISVIVPIKDEQENIRPQVEEICAALRRLAARGDVHILYAVHRNPQIWGPVHEMLEGVTGVTLTSPLSYPQLVHLMKRSYLILTDSGGIQEEAPTLGTPVLVLRETTERPEAVDAGAVRLVGAKSERIVEEASRLLDDAEEHGWASD